MSQSVVDVHLPSCQRFAVNGPLSAVGLGAVASGTATPADNGTVGVVGVFYAYIGHCIGDHRIVRVGPGSSGTTTVQIHRIRAGVWTELVTLSITTTAAFASATATVDGSIGVAPNPLAQLLAGDIVVARVTSREAGTPSDLTYCLELR